MSDLQLNWNAEEGHADLVLKNGDLALEKTGLKTAVIANLFTDKTASVSPAPVGANDPRGWWGGRVGSHLWQHRWAKNTRENALPVKNRAPKARPSKPCKAYLSPLVASTNASTNASSITVAAERTGSRVALAVHVNGVETEFKGGCPLTYPR